VTEVYVRALWQEIAAWQELDAVLHVQRKAIINRDSGQVWDCQERLRELLRQAIVACQDTARVKVDVTDEQGVEAERKAGIMRVQVRDAIRLNNDLLRDICSYLEMVREVAFPQTLPPTYANPRLSRNGQSPQSPPLTGAKVA
jgi:hypothetical protein